MQLGEPGEAVVAGPGAYGAHERDTLGKQAARDETEELGGGMVEPLRVVDDGDERLLLGDLGEQCQCGKSDQEAVGRGAGAQPEHRRERVALRHGQSLELIEHGYAELMEAGVGKLHLRLDAGGSRDVPAVDLVGDVGEQCALAHARISPQDCDTAATGQRVGQEPVERLTLGTTSQEPHRRPPSWRSSLDGDATPPRIFTPVVSPPRVPAPTRARDRPCTRVSHGRDRSREPRP